MSVEIYKTFQFKPDGTLEVTLDTENYNFIPQGGQSTNKDSGLQQQKYKITPKSNPNMTLDELNSAFSGMGMNGGRRRTKRGSKRRRTNKRRSSKRRRTLRRRH